MFYLNQIQTIQMMKNKFQKLKNKLVIKLKTFYMKKIGCAL